MITDSLENELNKTIQKIFESSKPKKMDLIKFQKVIEKEFDKDIATLVVAALAIQNSMKIKKKDMTNHSKFTEKRNKKVKSTLFEYSDKLDLVIEIIDAYYFYDLAICLGEEIKPFKEYMKMD